jgi:hypothetical protein
MKRRFLRDLQDNQAPATSGAHVILTKLSRLALLYAAEEPEHIAIVRLYRDQIKTGALTPIHTAHKAPDRPEERWVLQLGYRRLDEAWVDAETTRLTRRSLPTNGSSPNA